MNSSQIMKNGLISGGELDDMVLIDAGDGRILPYPLDGAYAVFSDGSAGADFLLGSDEILCSETVEVRVYVPESSTAQQCREYSKRLCLAAAQADEGRHISSISVSKCSFNEPYRAWEDVIVFSLVQSLQQE